MRVINILIGCICLFLFIDSCLAQGPKVSQHLLKNKDWGFLPNLGQLADEHGNPLSDIKYYGHEGSMYMYCRPGKLSFVFTKVVHGKSSIYESTGKAEISKSIKEYDCKEDKINATRMDMILIGANPIAEIVATEEQAYFENYYMAPNTTQGISNVHSFKTLTYKSIYYNIDLVIHSREHGIKYEFVVHPGGRVDDIQLQWYGLAKMEATIAGGVKYSMSKGAGGAVMEESMPISFYSLGKVKVASRFVIAGNKVAFKMGEYDHNQALTVDPELNWGTYYGGNDIDNGLKVCTDASSNVYIGGSTQSTRGFATSGSYHSSMSGSTDAYLAKFDYNGHIKWSTYFGGTNPDCTNSLALDSTGNIFITGYSYSDGIASSGAYQTSNGTNGDGFLAKFSNSGSLIWSTYFGATYYDIANDIALDHAGNAYIIGTTNSDQGLATSGAYKTSSNRYYHTFLARFSSTGHLAWSTYFGGDVGATYGNAIGTDASGNIFITGFTSTTDMASSGAYQTSQAGDWDAYIAKFKADGSLLWSSYFGGSNYDVSSCLCIDVSGNVYISGITMSKGIASTGAYQTSFGGMYDDFIAKFNSSGSLTWSTYFGGNDIDKGYGICTDKKGNVFITGNTSTLLSMATSGGYQTINGGNTDAFVAEFSSNGQLQWASYYGGTLEDDGVSVCTDPHGDILMLGNTKSKNGIASQGAYDMTRDDSAGTDVFIAKFSFPFQNDAGISAIKSPVGKGCVGITATKVTIKNYGTKPLKSLSIGWKRNGILQQAYSWTGNLASGDTTSITINNGTMYTFGTYDIQAFTYQPNGIIDSMLINDTIKGQFIVHPISNAAWAISNTGPVYHFKVLDSSQSHMYYNWVLSDGLHNNAYSFNHSFATIGTYKVTLITSNAFACVNVHDTSLIVSIANVGTQGSDERYNINIFPNPFNDKTIIHFNNPKPALIKITISDVTGKVLYSTVARNYNAGENKIELNQGDIGLSNGLFLVNIMIGEELITRKIVVGQ